MTPDLVLPCPATLGATWLGSGTHFAIYSGAAHGVDLCLYEPSTQREVQRIPLNPGPERIWHAYVPGIRPGQLYGYRVDGPYAPQEGLRFNAAKLLLDPYARSVSGLIPANDVLLGYEPAQPLLPDTRDSAQVMPKCVVRENRWNAGEDRHPDIPWDRTVLYECHVKGLTCLHPGVEPHLRGTYLGLASQPVIDHLLALGITAVELLPIQHFVNERRLVLSGLVNYWGYNTIGFFAPDPRYATSAGLAVEEFQTMVARLHRAGIEVILDVVYNHTAEGDERGPTLAYRGIDNQCYYHLESGAPERYVNHSACGNTLNTLHPMVQRLIMDSLRYWTEQMHVDGFRFDLAPALCREPSGIDAFFRFFGMILQDPVLSRRKLIVEPWDAGPDGMRLGRFPGGIAEWNGKYRDCIRRFWRGDHGCIAEFASRLAGSSDIFSQRRTPLAGINFVTCHDGSTLNDLVSYAAKHNELNGENNRDGPPDNFSHNLGTEGPTDDPQILSVRHRMLRNLFATLACSQGVPMLMAGDEFARTQFGNDNAYCQDNETSWVHWELNPAQTALLDFVRRALAIRREQPALRRNAFFNGRLNIGEHDVQWLDEFAQELSVDQWHDPQRRNLAMFIRDSLAEASDRHNDWKVQSGTLSCLLLLINAQSESQRFQLPGGFAWRELLNTGQSKADIPVKTDVILESRSMILLSSR